MEESDNIRSIFNPKSQNSDMSPGGRTVYEIDGKTYTENLDDCDSFEEFKLYAERIGESGKNETPQKLFVQGAENGFIINSSIFIDTRNFHTILQLCEQFLHCFVCDQLLLEDDETIHCISERHQLHLGGSSIAEQYPMDVLRPINDEYHCGICNDMFLKTAVKDHLAGETHKNNKIIASQKAAEIAIKRKINKIVYNKHNDERNNNNDTPNRNNDTTNNNNDKINNNNDMASYSKNDMRNNNDDKLIRNNYMTNNIIAKQIADNNMEDLLFKQRFITVPMKRRDFKIPFYTWHMISIDCNFKNLMFQCMACQIIDFKKCLDEHIEDDSHMVNLEKFKINHVYEIYLIRQDVKYTHCCTCNTLQYIDNTVFHVIQHLNGVTSFASVKLIFRYRSNENKRNDNYGALTWWKPKEGFQVANTNENKNKDTNNRNESNDTTCASLPQKYIFDVANIDKNNVNDNRTKNNDGMSASKPPKESLNITICKLLSAMYNTNNNHNDKTYASKQQQDLCCDVSNIKAKINNEIYAKMFGLKKNYEQNRKSDIHIENEKNDTTPTIKPQEEIVNVTKNVENRNNDISFRNESSESTDISKSQKEFSGDEKINESKNDDKKLYKNENNELFPYSIEEIKDLINFYENKNNYNFGRNKSNESTDTNKPQQQIFDVGNRIKNQNNDIFHRHENNESTYTTKLQPENFNVGQINTKRNNDLFNRNDNNESIYTNKQQQEILNAAQINKSRTNDIFYRNENIESTSKPQQQIFNVAQQINQNINNDIFYRNENNYSIHTPQPQKTFDVSKIYENKINNTNAIIQEQCFVFLFGFQIQVSVLSLNVIFPYNGDFFCGLCQAIFLFPNLQDHISTTIHSANLKSTPALQSYGFNFIRSIYSQPHCGICHKMILPQMMWYHLQDVIHMMNTNIAIRNTNIAMGIVNQHPPAPKVTRAEPFVQKYSPHVEVKNHQNYGINATSTTNETANKISENRNKFYEHPNINYAKNTMNEWKYENKNFDGFQSTNKGDIDTLSERKSIYVENRNISHGIENTKHQTKCSFNENPSTNNDSKNTIDVKKNDIDHIRNLFKFMYSWIHHYKNQNINKGRGNMDIGTLTTSDENKYKEKEIMDDITENRSNNNENINNNTYDSIYDTENIDKEIDIQNIDRNKKRNIYTEYMDSDSENEFSYNINDHMEKGYGKNENMNDDTDDSINDIDDLDKETGFKNIDKDKFINMDTEHSDIKNEFSDNMDDHMEKGSDKKVNCNTENNYDDIEDKNKDTDIKDIDIYQNVNQSTDNIDNETENKSDDVDTDTSIDVNKKIDKDENTDTDIKNINKDKNINKSTENIDSENIKIDTENRTDGNYITYDTGNSIGDNENIDKDTYIKNIYDKDEDMHAELNKRKLADLELDYGDSIDHIAIYDAEADFFVKKAQTLKSLDKYIDIKYIDKDKNINNNTENTDTDIKNITKDKNINKSTENIDNIKIDTENSTGENYITYDTGNSIEDSKNFDKDIKNIDDKDEDMFAEINKRKLADLELDYRHGYDHIAIYDAEVQFFMKKAQILKSNDKDEDIDIKNIDKDKNINKNTENGESETEKTFLESIKRCTKDIADENEDINYDTDDRIDDNKNIEKDDDDETEINKIKLLALKMDYADGYDHIAIHDAEVDYFVKKAGILKSLDKDKTVTENFKGNIKIDIENCTDENDDAHNDSDNSIDDKTKIDTYDEDIDDETNKRKFLELMMDCGDGYDHIAIRDAEVDYFVKMTGILNSLDKDRTMTKNKIEGNMIIDTENRTDENEDIHFHSDNSIDDDTNIKKYGENVDDGMNKRKLQELMMDYKYGYDHIAIYDAEVDYFVKKTGILKSFDKNKTMTKNFEGNENDDIHYDSDNSIDDNTNIEKYDEDIEDEKNKRKLLVLMMDCGDGYDYIAIHDAEVDFFVKKAGILKSPDKDNIMTENFDENIKIDTEYCNEENEDIDYDSNISTDDTKNIEKYEKDIDDEINKRKLQSLIMDYGERYDYIATYDAELEYFLQKAQILKSLDKDIDFKKSDSDTEIKFGENITIYAKSRTAENEAMNYDTDNVDDIKNKDTKIQDQTPKKAVEDIEIIEPYIINRDKHELIPVNSINKSVDKDKSRSDKTVIVDDIKLQLKWECWHSILRMDKEYFCIMCQKKISEEELDLHAISDGHIENLEKPFLRKFAIGLIREVTAELSHCATCNMAIDGEHIHTHVREAKHIKTFGECIQIE